MYAIVFVGFIFFGIVAFVVFGLKSDFDDDRNDYSVKHPFDREKVITPDTKVWVRIRKSKKSVAFGVAVGCLLLWWLIK